MKNNIQNVENISQETSWESRRDKLIKLLNDKRHIPVLEEIWTFIRDRTDDSFFNNNQNFDNLIKFLEQDDFYFTDNDIKNIYEFALYNESIIPNNVLPFINEMAATIPNLKTLNDFISARNGVPMQGRQGVLKYYENCQYSDEMVEFINRYRIVSAHGGNGNDRFLFTIDGGEILTCPHKAFNQIYPIIIKDIFKKSKILPESALENFNPTFADENQAKEFLKFFHRLSRSGSLSNLNQMDKDFFIFFSKSLPNIDQASFQKFILKNIRRLDIANIKPILNEKIYFNDKIKNFFDDNLLDTKIDLTQFLNEINKLDFYEFLNFIDSYHNHDGDFKTKLKTLLLNDLAKFKELVEIISVKINNQEDVASISHELEIFLDSSIQKISISEPVARVLDRENSLSHLPVTYDTDNYRKLFESRVNNILGSGFNFTNSLISKEISENIYNLLEKISSVEITNPENLIYKNNLLSFFSQFQDSRSLGRRQQTQFLTTLTNINREVSHYIGCEPKVALANFHLKIISEKILPSRYFLSQRNGNIRFGGGVVGFAPEDQLLRQRQNLDPVINDDIASSAYKLFLNMINEDANALDFAELAGHDAEKIMEYLFLGKGDQDLIDCLGEQNFKKLKSAIGEQSMRAIPKLLYQNGLITSNEFSSIVSTDGLHMGSRLDDSGFSIGIYSNNGNKIKLGIRLADGVVLSGIFDDNQNLIIDSSEIPDIVQLGKISNDSILKALIPTQYYDSQNQYSLRNINGQWWIGVFLEKSNSETEFKGAVKADFGLFLQGEFRKNSETIADIRETQMQINIPNQKPSISKSPSLSNPILSGEELSSPPISLVRSSDASDPISLVHSSYASPAISLTRSSVSDASPAISLTRSSESDASDPISLVHSSYASPAISLTRSSASDASDPISLELGSGDFSGTSSLTLESNEQEDDHESTNSKRCCLGLFERCLARKNISLNPKINFSEFLNQSNKIFSGIKENFKKHILRKPQPIIYHQLGGNVDSTITSDRAGNPVIWRSLDRGGR